MIKLIRQFFNKQQFCPSLLGVLLNPFYIARLGLYREIARQAPRLQGSLLDVGCGQQPYIGLFQVSQYVGLELDTLENRTRKQADYFYGGEAFPFEDMSFDCVLCNQVLEHVFNPETFLSEIRRVLKPGGRLILTVPFVWDEHEQPWDYARYTTFGLKSLLQKTGLEVIEQRKINANIGALFQLVNAYLYKLLWTRRAWLNLLICVFVMAPFNIFGLILGKLLPSNYDLYLDQVVLAERGQDA